MVNSSTILENITNISNIAPDGTLPGHMMRTIIEPSWIISSLLVLIIGYLIVYGMDFFLRILSEKLGTRRHILAMIIPVLKILVYICMVYVILSPLFDLGFTELAVFSGLIGAGLGFGLKDLVENIVAGFVIIIEKPYQIGDKIAINEHYGEVIDIGLIQTVIVTPGDSRVTIPNYLTVVNAVSSSNSGSAEMMVVTDLYLSYDADIDKAVRLLTEAVITSRYVYISEKRPYIILVENYPLYRKIIAKAYVNDLRHEFTFKTDITKRTWESYQDAGIKPPDIIGNGYPIPIDKMIAV
ncbi:mechanosensitive ion channel family protein [Methanospirillum lacunae]|uniref:Mechanosensitive ion channel protein MscS n=1 Tax=Methanospirillum lacunae TaxID=668570 RepID=A0A2V2MQB1_9EURY|nr:mechanosensitive ion channel domain-containing protein [Methanospirillum lacunae]PWR70424.1 mechanosensitive ion channel protein MscS [Methanospirillum lacunae]